MFGRIQSNVIMIRSFLIIFGFYFVSISDGQLDFFCFVLRPSALFSDPPQPSNSNPYQIEVSSLSYTPGNILTVTITTNQENPQVTFTEVYIAAVATNDSRTYIGNWSEQLGTSRFCEDKVLGYIAASSQSIQTFRWQLPMTESIPAGEFLFRATVVQEGTTYWGPDIESERIQLSTGNPLCPGTTCVNGQCVAIDGSGNGYTCICNEGYTGLTCDQVAVEFNSCDSVPCQNGGTCTSTEQGFSCQCPFGFTGLTCDLESSICDSDPCQNGATCYDLISLYICVCAPGFTGNNCEEAIDPCDPSPCENGATCFQMDSLDFFCFCPAGFNGETCAVESNHCESAPCQNGGSCTIEEQGFSCQCPAGFSGVTCDVDEPCRSDPCQNGAFCLNLDSDTPSFLCLCPPGFTGSTCGEVVDACDTDPCLNGGTCTSSGLNFFCSCPTGFTGSQCEEEVETLCSTFVCLNGGSCVETPGGIMAECICLREYTGLFCQTRVNPCNSQPCLNGGTCNRGTGLEYTCTCPSGFEGKNCGDAVHPCDFARCSNGGTCNRGTGLEYTCTCTSRFEGINCDNEVNPCGSQPCLNGGTCNRGTGLEYTCTCPSGFEGTDCGNAVNPCEPQPCLNGGTCNRGAGLEYTCTCPSGFEGMNCGSAVNPCDSQPCLSGGTCNRGAGLEYTCTCPLGFEGMNCGDPVVNPCAPQPCLNGGTCNRGTDLEYTCICPNGFEGTNCGDSIVNPCDLQPCLNGGTCNRETGLEYTCACSIGFEGMDCAVAVNPCDMQPCLNGGTCNRETGLEYTCTCPSGFEGNSCGDIADPCILQPCQNDGTCTNLNDGTFDCSCLEGFRGEVCEIDNTLLTTLAVTTEATPDNTLLTTLAVTTEAKQDNTLLTTLAVTTEAKQGCDPIDVEDSILNCNEGNGIRTEMCTLECDDDKVLSVNGYNTFTCTLNGNNPVWSPRPLENICQAKVNAVSRSQRMNVSITTTATDCSELNESDVDIRAFFRNIVQKAINSYCNNMTTCKERIKFNISPTECSSVINDAARRKRQSQVEIEASVAIEVATNLNDSSLETVIASLSTLVKNETMISVNNSYTVELTDTNKENIIISGITYICDPGHGNLGDGTCVMCPPGTKEESGSCMLCPMGTYQNLGGKTKCKSCEEEQITKTDILPGATQVDEVCIVVISEEPDEGLPIPLVAIIIMVSSLALCGFLILLWVIYVICCNKKTTSDRSRRSVKDDIEEASDPVLLDFSISEEPDSSPEASSHILAKAEDGDDEQSEASSSGNDDVDTGYHGSAGNVEVTKDTGIDLISITDGSIDEDFELGQHTYDDPASIKNEGGNQNIEMSSL